MSNKVVNRSSSNPAYFNTSGSAITGDYYSDVDGGAYMGGPSGERMSGINLGGTYHDVTDTGVYPDVIYKGLPGVHYESYGGESIHRFRSDYYDGVGPAIAAGYWNPVTGSWSTSPTGDVITFAADTTSYIVFTPGSANPDSEVIGD